MALHCLCPKRSMVHSNNHRPWGWYYYTFRHKANVKMLTTSIDAQSGGQCLLLSTAQKCSRPFIYFIPSFITTKLIRQHSLCHLYHFRAIPKFMTIYEIVLLVLQSLQELYREFSFIFQVLIFSIVNCWSLLFENVNKTTYKSVCLSYRIRFMLQWWWR